MSEFKDIQSVIETEQKPPLVSTFYGYFHVPQNLQGLAGIAESLNSNFHQAGGRRILYAENAGGTRPEADFVRKMVKQYGLRGSLVRHLMHEQLRREPTDYELADRLEDMQRRNVDDMVQSGILPLTQLQTYGLYTLLDKQAAHTPFEYEQEAHSKNVATEIRASDAIHAGFSGKMRKEWESGDFDTLIASAKRFYAYLATDGNLRDRSIAQDATNRIKALRREKQSSAIFFLFGDTHRTFAQATKRKFAFDKRVNFQIREGPLSEIPDSKIVSLLKNDAHVSDDIYARSRLISQAIGQCTSQAAENGTLEQFGLSFEDTVAKVTAAANSLSVEDIRKICESKASALDVVGS